ncbi:MAG: hypothetical protein ABI856_15710 [Nitrospira sp.]
MDLVKATETMLLKGDTAEVKISARNKITGRMRTQKMLGANLFMVDTTLVENRNSHTFPTHDTKGDQSGIPGRWPRVTITTVWISSLIAILSIAPDHERYHRRVERMEQVLRSRCTEWSVLKDVPSVPTHQLIVRKCLPRNT